MLVQAGKDQGKWTRYWQGAVPDGTILPGVFFAGPARISVKKLVGKGEQSVVTQGAASLVTRGDACFRSDLAGYWGYEKVWHGCT